MDGILPLYFVILISPLDCQPLIRFYKTVTNFWQMFGRLLQAQQYHKRHYDAKHRELHFDVGQWVWLRLHHRQAISLVDRANRKLAPRYYGPYQVLECIGSVAYKLQLPTKAKIHNVFHVSLLKPYHGEPPVQPPALPALEDGRVIPTPRQVTRSRLSRGVRELLVHWMGLPDLDAS